MNNLNEQREKFIRQQLSNGVVLLLSGYQNSTKTDRTWKLAKEFKQNQWLKYDPLVLPSIGYWEGETEQSLAVVLRKKADSLIEVADLMPEYRRLLTKYGQQAGLLGRRGFYWAIGREATQDSPLGSQLEYGTATKGLAGYTIVYANAARQTEVLRFGIRESAQQAVAA